MWVCGRGTGRNCMVQRANRNPVEHGCWAMDTPTRKRIKKKRAERVKREAAEATAAPAAARESSPADAESPSLCRSPRNAQRRRLKR
eukprot:4713436-Pleurochrysis_carterae.AAC.2